MLLPGYMGRTPLLAQMRFTLWHTSNSPQTIQRGENGKILRRFSSEIDLAHMTFADLGKGEGYFNIPCGGLCRQIGPDKYSRRLIALCFLLFQSCLLHDLRW